MKALSEEFGWSRAQLGGAMSVNLILYSLLSPVVGIFLDRIGSRVILATGGILLGSGLWWFGSLDTLAGLYLSFGAVTALGLSLTYFVPNLSLARKWFYRRAGLAAGIVALGSGLGLAFIAPAANFFVEEFGWRTGIRIIAAAAWACIIPLAILLVRSSPESIGLAPDGAPAGTEHFRETDPPPRLRDILDHLRSGIFIHLFFLYFVYSLAVCGVLTHFFLWGTKDLSLSGSVVAGALSLQTVFATGSRILGGWLSDRWGRLPFITLSLGGLGIAFLLGLVTRGRSELYLFAVVFGISYGLPLAVYPAYVGDLFGRSRTGSLYGFIIMAGGLSGGIGAWSYGLASDLLGSYHAAYLGSIILLVCGLVSAFLLRSIHKNAREKSPAG